MKSFRRSGCCRGPETLLCSSPVQSPEVLATIKRLALANVNQGSHDGFRAEIDAYNDHVRGKDLVEGLTAFRNKRQPNYQ